MEENIETIIEKLDDFSKVKEMNPMDYNFYINKLIKAACI